MADTWFPCPAFHLVVVTRKRHIMHGHFWSLSCFAASCGGAPLNIIRQYIEQ